MIVPNPDTDRFRKFVSSLFRSLQGILVFRAVRCSICHQLVDCPRITGNGSYSGRIAKSFCNGCWNFLAGKLCLLHRFLQSLELFLHYAIP